MKLEKAIEILTILARDKMPPDIDAFNHALDLGIEALKRLKFGRNHPSGWELEQLPGETTD